MTDPIDYQVKYQKLRRRSLAFTVALACVVVIGAAENLEQGRLVERLLLRIQKDQAMMTYAQKVITNLTAADKQLETDCKQLADLPSIHRPDLNCHLDGDLQVCDDLPSPGFTINSPTSGCASAGECDLK